MDSTTSVRAYTMGSAYASGDEKLKGSIEVGKLANLVALSADIFKIDPVEIGKTKFVAPVFDGKLIYASAGSAINSKAGFAARILLFTSRITPRRIRQSILLRSDRN